MIVLLNLKGKATWFGGCNKFVFNVKFGGVNLKGMLEAFQL